MTFNYTSLNAGFNLLNYRSITTVDSIWDIRVFPARRAEYTHEAKTHTWYMSVWHIDPEDRWWINHKPLIIIQYSTAALSTGCSTSIKYMYMFNENNFIVVFPSLYMSLHYKMSKYNMIHSSLAIPISKYELFSGKGVFKTR